MNFKIFFFTLLLAPMVSFAETQNQSIQKPKEGFVTWRKVAATTGVAGLIGIVGGLVGNIKAGEKAESLAKPHVLQHAGLHIQKVTRLNMLTLEQRERHIAGLVNDFVTSSQDKDYERGNIKIPPLNEETFLKYRLTATMMALGVLVGGALAVTCLGTLTYALIKKLKAKPEDEQKSANAKVA